MKVAEVCRTGVVTIRASDTVVDAAAKMRRYHVGDLVVVEDDPPHARPIGIVTDRDIAIGLVGDRVPNLERLLVEDVIVAGALITALEEDDVDDVHALMKEHAVRRVPVVDQAGFLVGIYTLDDGVRLLVEELSELLGEVERQRKREVAERR